MLLMLVAGAQANGDEKSEKGPISQGQRIFYTGHSFIMFIPPYMDEFTEVAGIKGQTTLGHSWLGGSTTLQHWDVGSKGKLPLKDINRIYGNDVTEAMTADEPNFTKKILRTQQVDVLTLAPLYKADDGIDKFATLALEHNPNIRITVEQIWLRRGDAAEPVAKDYPNRYKGVEDYNTAKISDLRERSAAMFKSISDAVAEENKKIGKPVLFVVPCGQAVIELREKIVAGKAGMIKTQSALFTDLTGHGTGPLKALVAYCHYAVIYRRSPVGLPMPKALAKDCDAATLQVLQETAWDAVIHHPLSGVTEAAK